MSNSTETKEAPPDESVHLGHVFCYPDDCDMNAAALLKYLQALKRKRRKIDVVEFAIEEAEVLLEGGNEIVGLNNFAHEVGLRVLSVLE